MGGPQADTDDYGIIPLHQLSQIGKTSRLLTFLHEDDSTIDDGHFLYSVTTNSWFNVPSWLHQNGTALAFADGHVEYWKWRSAPPPTTYFTEGSAVPDPLALEDIARLNGTAAGSN
jgi:prepilin-type processing-associated H-X9-DG protein